MAGRDERMSREKWLTQRNNGVVFESLEDFLVAVNAAPFVSMGNEPEGTVRFSSCFVLSDGLTRHVVGTLGTQIFGVSVGQRIAELSWFPMEPVEFTPELLLCLIEAGCKFNDTRSEIRSLPGWGAMLRLEQRYNHLVLAGKVDPRGGILPPSSAFFREGEDMAALEQQIAATENA